MSESKKSYLIRSSGQILGPFSETEVIDLIKQGKISVFDEVAEPFSIWRYLQDHKKFKKTVHSMDVQTRLSNFLTQITGKISTNSKRRKNQTSTYTLTDNVTKEESLNQNIAVLDPNKRQSAQEVKIQTLDQAKAPSSPSIKYTSQQNSEEILRKKINRIINFSWYIIALSILSIGLYIFYKEFIIPSQTRNSAVEEFKNKGLKLYESGNYKKALPYFEKVYSQNILKDQNKLLLASIFVQENKIQRAKQIVSELSNSPSTQTGNWFLLNGMIAFFEDNYTQAEEYFKSALKQKESSALLNLSILKWRQKKYTESLLHLDNLVKSGYERDIASYLRALNLLSQNRYSDLIAYINKDLALNTKDNFVKEYKSELYLMQTYAYMKREQTEQIKTSVNKLLNEDPFFYRDYKYSSFIIAKNLSWTLLYPHCKDIYKLDTQNHLLNALYGFCNLKTGNFKQGAMYIEQAKNGKPDKPLFLSLYAYLLMLQNKDFELQQVFSLIKYDELTKAQSPLPLILKAHFLEKSQNWSKALDTWKNLLFINEKQIQGIAGVAIANYELGNSSTAEIYRDRGLNIYPYHVRLLSYK